MVPFKVLKMSNGKFEFLKYFCEYQWETLQTCKISFKTKHITQNRKKNT